MTLLFMGLFLAFMTMLKTSCYFGSSAIMIPLRTGVVRDIRVMVYSKVMHLPLGFFSEERKGDIIARMSGDVGEIENSITSSLDMLLKNPILILLYFSTLIVTSWQLTLFTVLVLPGMGWLMGKVGKKLKRKSLEAQGKWSDTMSQLEETLGGLRIIKAFIAEDKRLFQLRHGITPFPLGFQRLTLQFLADFSHQTAHTRQYQDSKQSQLPAGYNQSGKIKQNQDRILEQHIQ
jgi:ATP-binding cassette subfamily B protein/subfamily B ATP-binding cassette protein MsbA